MGIANKERLATLEKIHKYCVVVNKVGQKYECIMVLISYFAALDNRKVSRETLEGDRYYRVLHSGGFAQEDDKEDALQKAAYHHGKVKKTSV